MRTSLIARIAIRCRDITQREWLALLFSQLVILMTATISYWWQLAYVVSVAKRAVPTDLPPDSILVVLGKRLRNGALDSDYQLRLRRAYQLYRAGVRQKIVIVGGPTGDDGQTEAGQGRAYLVSLGVAAQDIQVEEQSLHTQENFAYIKVMLAPLAIDRFVLITNRYHLARTLKVAKVLGLNPILCGAEPALTMSLRALPRWLLEAYYLHWYRVGGALLK